jgi:hypothetical protein
MHDVCATNFRPTENSDTVKKKKSKAIPVTDLGGL